MAGTRKNPRDVNPYDLSEMKRSLKTKNVRPNPMDVNPYAACEISRIRGK